MTESTVSSPRLPTTPCREYPGRGRYAHTSLNGKPVTLHRWIVEQVEGPLLPGEVVRHKCNNTRCYRYDHLLRGTQYDNMHDMIEQGRCRWALDRCPAGHLYDEANTHLDKHGWRHCRLCNRDRARARV